MKEKKYRIKIKNLNSFFLEDVLDQVKQRKKMRKLNKEEKENE